MNNDREIQRQYISSEAKALTEMITSWAVLFAPMIIQITFLPVRGRKGEVLDHMRADVERYFYSRLVTRIIRKPNHPEQSFWLPKLMMYPDVPVYKSDGDSMSAAAKTYNWGGIHYIGILLVPRKLPRGQIDYSRLKGGSISEVYCKPLEHLGGWPDYCMKGLRSDFELTEFIITKPSPLRTKEARDPVDAPVRNLVSATNFSPELCAMLTKRSE